MLDKSPSAALPTSVRADSIEMADGPTLHTFTPKGPAPRPGLLWMHGGGMVVGNAKQDFRSSGQIAADLGITVVSVDYRLAPEHPFPAPLDDCWNAWTWLLSKARELGIDPQRLAIGGQSAGGGLAAALAQRILDEGGLQPRAQWLFCPMLDDRTAANTDLDDVRHFLWHNRSNRIGWSAYLREPPGAADVAAYAAPARRLSLAGLPSTWIGTGDIELFHAENLAYARRLDEADVSCLIDIVPGAPHAFESVAPKASVARAYQKRARLWLRDQLTQAQPEVAEQ